MNPRMKKILYLLLTVTLCACGQQGRMASGDSLVLDGGWQLSREGAAEQYAATVPSTVCGALSEAGYFGEDLFDGRNYAAVDKAPFDDVWTYSTEFAAKPAAGQFFELAFDGLNYYADIFLNGTQLASSDTTFGVFRRRAYEVGSLLKGNNRLEVKLRRAQKGDLNIGFVDWNPRPFDESMGIVRPVTLRATGAVSVEDVFVVPDLNVETLAEANLELRVKLRNHADRAVEGTLVLALDGVGEASVPVSLPAAAQQTVVLTPEQVAMLHLENPRVWWSYDLGTPELYHLSACVKLGGAVSDRKEVDFGVRKITSCMTAENYRQFKLNGRDILIKGAGWTDDLFLRDTPESIRQQVEYVMDMNLNCIRFENIWGKDDTVYDLCDRLGVLALVGWSCQWEWEDYCGLPEVHGYGCINTPETEDLAVAYFRDQVVRLHNHAALIGWLTGSDRIPNPRLEQRYMEIYNAEEYRPYVCSAKNLESTITGWSGTKMEGPYEYVGPDYWFRDKEAGGAFGFNTETGIGANLPQAESLRRMIPEEELWPLSDSWSYHCTASGSAMNSPTMLNTIVTAQYGAATGFADFVRKAHAVDYDGTRAMFEAFRARLPKSTGIVQWMLNSAWPSLYWQLYDWYGAPTAGYYGTKKACEPVQLIFDYADRKVYAVSERPEAQTLKATYLVYDEHSRVLGGDSREITLGYRQSLPVFDLRRFDGKPHFVALTLTQPDGTPVADNFYCLPARDNEYNWSKTNWYLTPITRHADLRFVFAQEPADVQMSVAGGEGTWTVTLTNKSDVIAYMNIVKALDAAGQLVAPAFWSDNFFPLLPGQTKTVTCRTEAQNVHFVLDSGASATPLTEEEDISRNRSKYANDQFSEDDQYTVAEPYETVTVQQPKGKKIKNVIFMIGDGMGVEQVSCGWVLNGGHLNMDNMPVSGFSRTYATDRLVTDSCAGGSALATGVKTRYHYMGVDPDGNPVPSLLHDAQRKGMKTGVTVTCRINDATPLDFVGHSLDRDEEEINAAQYVDSGVDFLCGGGIQFWQNRSDGRDLVQEMVDRGYTFVDTREALNKVESGRVLGLFAPLEMEPALDRGPILEDSTMKAIELLDNKKGFFLMVEGSSIDDWCHRKKVGYMAEELFDFDRTIGKVLKWAEQDGQTLVIVTADHATGGLTLIDGSLENRTVKVHFSTKGHNGILVPVFAYGPHAEAFTGVHENGEIGQIVRALMK